MFTCDLDSNKRQRYSAAQISKREKGVSFPKIPINTFDVSIGEWADGLERNVKLTFPVGKSV